MNFELARTQMLGQQLRAWEVLDERVLAAFGSVPRERFAPEDYSSLAFADTEIPLPHGQGMLAPKIEGRILQALGLEPVDEVLEVGTGTGYLTAVMARLARRVVSLDIFPDFVEQARSALAQREIGGVELVTADAFAFAPAARFDAIAVTGSVPELDDHFIRMLKPGGRLFIVVGRAPVMEARLVTKAGEGRFTSEGLFETVLTPLVNAERPEPFVL
jgi:protein-L-isoaspartate(D-aspartate) O-methyltransferase